MTQQKGKIKLSFNYNENVICFNFLFSSLSSKFISKLLMLLKLICMHWQPYCIVLLPTYASFSVHDHIYWICIEMIHMRTSVLSCVCACVCVLAQSIRAQVERGVVNVLSFLFYVTWRQLFLECATQTISYKWSYFLPCQYDYITPVQAR